MKYLLPGLALFLLTNCKEKEAKITLKDPVSLPVIQLQKTDTVISKHYVAGIQAKRNVELRAKVTGYIDRILVDEGGSVQKGQLLFQLNDAEFQEQVSQARASLANAKSEALVAELDLKRIKLLVDKNIISSTEYKLGEAKLNSAKSKVHELESALRNAEIRLSYTRIRSPFDGIIDRIPFKSGSLVSEGNLLTTVSDLSAVYAYFNVSENEYLHYTKSLDGKANPRQQPVTLHLSDGSGYPHVGRIETMESEFDKATGTIAFRASFPNPRKLLKHGASGKVSLATRVSDAIIIPQKAVFEIQDKNYVFVVGKDSTVNMKSFEPDTRLDEYIIVRSGLSANDRIVYEGIQNIRDGARITPQIVPANKKLNLAAITQ